MPLDYAPAPVRDAIAEPNPDGKLILPRVWVDYFSSLGTRINSQSIKIDSVRLPEQGGTIGVSVIPVPTSGEALYRLSYYLRVTTVPSVSGSLEVILGWTDGGVNCTQKFPPLKTIPAVVSPPSPAVPLTTSSIQTNMITVRNDANTLMTYAINYLSDAAGTMKYSFDLVAEQV